MATRKKKAPAKKKVNAQLWSVLLFSGGILILLMALIEGTSAWTGMHNFVRGVFGVGVFLVPAILIYAAILIATEKTKAVAGKIIQGVILIALICGALHIFFFGDAEFLDINDVAEFLYKNGTALKGGGFFSIFLGVPLVTFLGKVGATIVILLLIFVFVMLLTGISLMDFLGLFTKPFVKAKDAILEAGEEDAAMAKQRAAERQTKNAKKLPPNEPMPPEARKPKIENIDIPIPVEPKSQPVVENTPCENAIKEAPAKKPDLDAIIKKVVDTSAAEQPKAEENVKPTVVEENGQTRLYEKSEPAAEYKYPPISLLNPSKKSVAGANTQTELKQSADTLVNTLKSFGVQTRIVDIHRGPTVTRYELQPSAGVKISKITGLADDIALNLAAAGVRIEAPIPGKAAVGIEVPNKTVDVVTLREIVEAKEFDEAKSKVSFALGRDIAGNVIMADIAKMPHVLIAGSTGSGKSVCINSIIMSILYKSSPEEVKILMIDPKVVELGVYNGIPHLLIPVVTEPRKAAGALNWAVQEMLKRYKLFADNNVRDLTGYNALAETKEDMDTLPQIVLIIDELADLMMAAPNEVEDSICRLAQMARAAGMHLVIATQRPSVDIITGVIKANIPSRIAFAVSSQIDSRTILDGAGAEKLLGRGDMLFYPSGMPKPTRVQGCFVTDKEVENVVGFIKDAIKADYDDNIMKEIEENAPAVKGEKTDSAPSGGGVDSDDEMTEKAIEVVVEAGQASTSLLQRRLKLGYARAARIIDELEQMGVVGTFEGAKPRQVLISKEQWYERKLRTQMSDAPKDNANV